MDNKSIPPLAAEESKEPAANGRQSKLKNVVQLLRRTGSKQQKQENNTALARTQAHRLRKSERTTFLNRLPPEVWLMVVAHLDIADAASLALTTSSMAAMFLDTTLPTLNHADMRIIKNHFLTYLDRDYPDHLLCFDCQTYHRRDAREALGLKCFRAPIRAISPGEVHLLWPYVCVRFRAVQLTMRAHRFRSLAYGISLAAFEEQCSMPHTRASEAVADVDASPWTRTVRAALTQAESPPHLLVRVESVLSTARYALLQPQERGALQQSAGLPRCAHWQHIDAMARLVGPVLDQFLAGAPGAVAARCNYCASNYTVEAVVAPGGAGSEASLHVTAWVDFGDGVSPHRGEWFALLGTQYFDASRAVEMIPSQRAEVKSRFDAAVQSAPGPALASAPKAVPYDSGQGIRSRLHGFGVRLRDGRARDSRIFEQRFAIAPAPVTRPHKTYIRSAGSRLR